ncbi:MAG: UDP-2,3-diacylglucosamine diphosphatase [Alcaligenaceae bacterium]|nr:UDP-2,3-diacylglucosamine diphosphatase [Alcaligenaceae bacterium]
MNKLRLPGRIWVASDIHLGPDSPATAAAFFNFLEQAAQQADALILAGDIFDAWIGDDVALQPEPWLQDALHALHAAVARIPLWLGRGNRDFLIGKSLLRRIGAHALPEPALLETDAGQILLAHGDEYCTADPGYQRFRRIVRNTAVQRSYLALPLRLRRGIADWARARSRHSNQYKAAVIMDVEPSAIAQALRETGAPMLIHGHTHRPARHALKVEGRECERLVLPDWDFDHADAARGGWIVIDSTGARIVQY